MQSRSARPLPPTAMDNFAVDGSFAALVKEMKSGKERARRRQALAELATLLTRDGIDDGELATLLEAAAGLEWPPATDEAVRLGAVARAVGRRRLIAALDIPGKRRLGAVRLLLEAGR